MAEAKLISKFSIALLELNKTHRPPGIPIAKNDSPCVAIFLFPLAG